MCDHVLMLALSINKFTRTFHWWSISCHSSVQSVPGGGPTIDLHNFRKRVMFQKLCFRIAILTPEGDCKSCGGCASFVRSNVSFAFRIKPICDSTVTKSFFFKSLQQFQHMKLQIIGCLRQNADPATQVGHPLSQIVSRERRPSNFS